MARNRPSRRSIRGRTAFKRKPASAPKRSAPKAMKVRREKRLKARAKKRGITVASATKSASGQKAIAKRRIVADRVKASQVASRPKAKKSSLPPRLVVAGGNMTSRQIMSKAPNQSLEIMSRPRKKGKRKIPPRVKGLPAFVRTSKANIRKKRLSKKKRSRRLRTIRA
tara:strand:- start:458 stop:961 length:504 start_codon:yes stop_codon:yes gene_type:complete